MFMVSPCSVATCCAAPAQAVFVLWAAFTVSFVVLYALPERPGRADVRRRRRPTSPPEQLDELRAEYGLDQPLLVQYVDQLGDGAARRPRPSVQSRPAGRPR